MGYQASSTKKFNMKNVRPKNKEALSDQPKKKRINSKDKGDRYEQWLAKFWKEQLGYPFCKTSRVASKMLDDCKIDLSGIPYNVQAKSGYWKYRPKPDVIFKSMKALLESNYDARDQVHSWPRILFHKLDGHQPEHHLVTMIFDDWIKIFKAYEQQQINPENKGDTDSNS